MDCPKWEECFHEYCVREKRCTNADFWARYWRNQRELKPPESGIVKTFKERQRINKTEKRKEKLLKKAFNKKRNFHMRQCKPRQVCCHLPKVCGLLGECILTQSRTLTRPDLIPALQEAKSTRAAVKILEEIMPSLKRYNDKANFRPER